MSLFFCLIKNFFSGILHIGSFVLLFMSYMLFLRYHYDMVAVGPVLYKNGRNRMAPPMGLLYFIRHFTLCLAFWQCVSGGRLCERVCSWFCISQMLLTHTKFRCICLHHPMNSLPGNILFRSGLLLFRR